MSTNNNLRIDQNRMESFISDSSAHIPRTYLDDVIKKSEHSAALRESYSVFLGAYKAVKSALKDNGVCSEIQYYDREALLDCYSIFIAAGEALGRMESAGLEKIKDTKLLLNKDIDLRKHEKDQTLRERLITSELINAY